MRVKKASRIRQCILDRVLMMMIFELMYKLDRYGIEHETNNERMRHRRHNFQTLTNIVLNLQYRRASNPDSYANHRDPLNT